MAARDGEADAGRRLAAERDLAAVGFGHLTEAFLNLPFEALAPVKTLLKRFFSTGPWTPEDDQALAEAVGAGEGTWERPLDSDLALSYGWLDGRFFVRVTSVAGSDVAPPAAGQARTPDAAAVDALASSFDGPVVPEATPNPRTIRFQVGPIHDGPSRWYESAAAAQDDPSASRLFAEFDEVANVLVGPDFVAVGLRRASDWERLLSPVLAVVTDEFASDGGVPADDTPRVMGGPARAGVVAGQSRPGTGGATNGSSRVSRLEQAWQALGSLRPADPDDAAAVQAAAVGEDPFRRQVAANLLKEVDAVVALVAWQGLVHDKVRSVRRAAVDAMVDAGREELRPLLESALDDADAWVRWKALRGLAELGAEGSRAIIESHADDRDFRVRLEVAAALRWSPAPDPGPAT